MLEYLSPGVYVEEFEMGGRPVAGVSTSTAGFIGLSERGETEGLPELVTNFGDFQRKFGGFLSDSVFGSYRYLAFAVEHFFINGGSRCFVMRVAPPDAKPAQSNEEIKLIKIESKNQGAWGNQIQIILTPSSNAKTQIKSIIGDVEESCQYRLKNSGGFNTGDIVVYSDGEIKQYCRVEVVKDDIITLSSPLEGKADVIDEGLIAKKTLSTCEFTMQIIYFNEVELHEKLSLNPLSSKYVENVLSRSSLVKVKDISDKKQSEIVHPFEAIAGKNAELVHISLSGGSDGAVTNVTPADFIGVDKGPGKRTGIQAFIDNDDVSIMAVPGIVDPNVQLSLVAHCEKLTNRFAVLDVPKDAKKVSEVTDHRNIFDTSYAAMYHPWLQVYDTSEKRSIMIPPSGSIAGIYSRTDQTRGVHKAPANEGLRATTGLDCQYNTGEQDILNPKGVNLIRYFSGQGIKVWGARTCSSNTLWKYVNVRRLFIFLEESIKRGTQWVVFEPNDEKLWARVNRTITSFLTTVWREGALAGSTPSEAFFVKIDRTTMSQDDIDNGKLICFIGVSPVKPAEFVIFRIAQNTGNAE